MVVTDKRQKVQNQGFWPPLLNVKERLSSAGGFALFQRAVLPGSVIALFIILLLGVSYGKESAPESYEAERIETKAASDLYFPTDAAESRPAETSEPLENRTEDPETVPSETISAREAPETLTETPAVIEEETNIEDQPESQLLPLAYKSHTVNKNETISQIAWAYSLKPETLISVNSLTRPGRLKEGTILKIPNQDGLLYQAPRKKIRSDLAAEYKIKADAIRQVNRFSGETLAKKGTLFLPGASLTPEEMKKLFKDEFIYPLPGPVIKEFGIQMDPVTELPQLHNAIDILADKDDPVRAARDGYVSKTGWDKSYGFYMFVSHEDGFVSLYSQLGDILFSSGEKVRFGEVIASVGKPADLKKEHLHFSLFFNNDAVDPVLFLN